ncbi:MAG: hypothetical protein U5K53_04865 [Halanaerobiales bacterium]|nr:hypothetical protein [Halanaerobiales bacterium]
MQKSKSKLKVFKFLNLVSLVLVLFINFLANYLPINGYNTGELSDVYPNLFVPAGITFSIWGLIYLFLTIFIVFQFIPMGKNEEIKNNIIQKIGYLFFFSSIANAGWILAWHYLYIFLSLLVMISLLLILIKIYNNLNIGIKEYNKKIYTIFIMPFSVYLGWITVATIANVTALLVDINWNGFGFSDIFWTVAVIIVGLIITLYNLLKRKDIAYSLVIVWAYFGIVIKRYFQDPDPIMIIVYAASISIVLIFISIANTLARKTT